MFFAPLSVSSRAIALPAAPTPLKTILTEPRSFLTNLRAFRSAARTTIAVPC